MIRWLIFILCLSCMLPQAACAMEGAYLSGEDMQSLEPAYEEFLETLADTLVERGLLSEGERDEWLMYQLGDFMQNGGFGTISILYAPGTLNTDNTEAITLRRYSVDTGAGVLWLDTLRRYAENYSPLPGLPLDTELLDEEDNPLPCRFRWTASDGAFLIWDGVQEEVVSVGATYVSDGRPLYWYAEPVEGTDALLTLELLYEMEDSTIASYTLTVVSGADYWAPEALQ